MCFKLNTIQRPVFNTSFYMIPWAHISMEIVAVFLLKQLSNNTANRKLTKKNIILKDINETKKINYA